MHLIVLRRGGFDDARTLTPIAPESFPLSGLGNRHIRQRQRARRRVPEIMPQAVMRGCLTDTIILRQSSRFGSIQLFP